MTFRLRPTDVLFSKCLRKKRGYRSDMSGTFYPEGKGLQVSHFHGRRHENTRFDEDNCDILSFTEHQNFEENPSEYTEWKKKQLGEKKYKELMIRANLYCKKDDKKVMIYLKNYYKDFI